MSFATWLAFFGAAWVIALSPGSGAVLAMSHGLSFGLKRSSITVLGMQTGLLLIFLVAGAGAGSILLASEWAFGVVKVVGALYLIWLGVAQWRSKAAIATGNTVSVSAMPSARKRFLIGFFTNVTNPKGILFMVAVLPQFIHPQRPLLPQLLFLGITMVSVDITVMHGYAFAAASMQRFFQNARAVAVQNRVFGSVLMMVGTGLFFIKRSAAA